MLTPLLALLLAPLLPPMLPPLLAPLLARLDTFTPKVQEATRSAPRCGQCPLGRRVLNRDPDPGPSRNSNEPHCVLRRDAAVMLSNSYAYTYIIATSLWNSYAYTYIIATSLCTPPLPHYNIVALYPTSAPL